VHPIYRTGTPLPSKNPIYIYFFQQIYILNFLNMLHTSFFSLQNAVYFIMLPFLVLVLFAFYIQGVLKFKYQIPVPKGYIRKKKLLQTHCNEKLDCVSGSSPMICPSTKIQTIKKLLVITLCVIEYILLVYYRVTINLYSKPGSWK
jgi:hypothetical protein